MTRILIPTARQIVEANKYICSQDGNPHHCYGIGKIESALHTAPSIQVAIPLLLEGLLELLVRCAFTWLRAMLLWMETNV